MSSNLFRRVSQNPAVRRAWKPALGAAVLLGGTAAWYRYRQRERDTFDISIRVRDDKGHIRKETRATPMLFKDEVEARLKEHEEAVRTARPGGIIWNEHTSYVFSNDPGEDRHASKIVQRDPSDPSSPGDLLFYAVMDGHGGFHTSQLLQNVLLPAVALELHTLIHETPSILARRGLLHDLMSIVRPPDATRVPLDSIPTHLEAVLQRAFEHVDSEIVDGPLRLLASELSNEKHTPGLPDLSQHPMALPMMLPALSGSCSILALFDTAHRNMYVANTGDCRAVAGHWVETADGKGTWKVDVLTEDQTGRNPNEVKRIQSEHPPEESDLVIARGRIWGGLEPSRAFGDARYKWSREVQSILNGVFLKGHDIVMRVLPPSAKSPPYVTAKPVVTHRKLDFLPDPSEPKTQNPQSTLRFVVLATDGLWDELSSEDVVALVGGYLSGLKGIIPKSQLPGLVPTISGTTVEGKVKRERDTEGSWAFVDDNIGTHLIRNAFGGGDEKKLTQMLSIPAPHSRRYRDDVTVTVVFWEKGQEDAAQTTTISTGTKQGNVKAKL